jgi:hypothetical protein
MRSKARINLEPGPVVGSWATISRCSSMMRAFVSGTARATTLSARGSAANSPYEGQRAKGWTEADSPMSTPMGRGATWVHTSRSRAAQLAAQSWSSRQRSGSDQGCWTVKLSGRPDASAMASISRSSPATYSLSVEW